MGCTFLFYPSTNTGDLITVSSLVESGVLVPGENKNAYTPIQNPPISIQSERIAFREGAWLAISLS